VSAGSDPNDWTELERWPPMRDGAAGDDESNGFGESTDPNARGPVCMSAIRSEHVGLPLPSWRGRWVNREKGEGWMADATWYI
jgi:hypothetical protein